MSLIRLQAAALAFGHVALLDDAEFDVDAKERVCLIGRNGAGKSTLLDVLAGERTLDGGTLWRRDGITIAKLAQAVPDAESSSLFEVVAAGLGDHAGLLARYHTASGGVADGTTALQEFSRVQAEVEQAGAWDGSQRVDAVLDRLRLPPDALMADCSGGLRRRAMLGRALVAEPDLLLLDEPTNHLDIPSIEALEEAVAGFPGAVVFVTHDRTFIDRLASRIVELDRGHLRSFPGRYADYLRRSEELLSAEADANRKFDQRLAEEEVWIRQGIKARRTRNEGRARRLQQMRGERADRRDRPGQVKLDVSRGERSGRLVVEASSVAFGYGGQPVIDRFSTKILRGDRIGIIGANGSGKTTLLRLILGELAPTDGTVRLGEGLNIAYFDQERQQLNPETTVRDNVADGSDQINVGGKTRHVVGYLGDFLFPPARIHAPVKTLSGGERNRLLLARLFAKPANLLVLDEPTNDLDVETLELLEDLLIDYDGTLLLVSHDRSFLDRTVTSTLSIAADGRVEEHVGGYSDWLAYQQRRTAASATETAKSKSSLGRPGATHTDEAGTSNTTVDRKPGRRLSYKERRELQALPELIETLEAEQAKLQAATADPQFYKGPADEVTEMLKTLAEIEARLESAFERWSELEGA